MRKSIKAFVCAVSALVICAAPNIANYAVIADNTSITAEAADFGTLIAESISKTDYARVYPYPYRDYKSPNKRFKLQFQQDGNLVVYPYCESLFENGAWYWNTRTSNTPKGNCYLQPDGNLVIYNQAGNHAVWNSSTCSKSSERLNGIKRLYLNNLGQLVITFKKNWFSSEREIWNSKTNTSNTGAIFNNKIDPLNDIRYKMAGYYSANINAHSGTDPYIKIHFPNPSNNNSSRVDYFRVGYKGKTITGTMYIPKDGAWKNNQTGNFYYKWYMMPPGYANMEDWTRKSNEGFEFHCNEQCTNIAGVGVDIFTKWS